MVIVTSGAHLIDIDAYACCVAYAEFLKLTGRDAEAASSAQFNESITPSIRTLNAPIRTDYKPDTRAQFIVIDASDPAELDPMVDEARVIGIIDHHSGFEHYWQEKLGNTARIESVGAAATLVYEIWEASGRLDQLSQLSAELLAAALLDNTLDFKSDVTTDRDKRAYRSLVLHASLDGTWAMNYFNECQQIVLRDMPSALKNDSKFLTFRSLPEQLCIGQMVVWDAKPVIANDLKLVADVLSSVFPFWMANIVSISEGHSYFVTDNETIRQWLSRLFRVEFNGQFATADRLWLRSEIIKRGSAI